MAVAHVLNSILEIFPYLLKDDLSENELSDYQKIKGLEYWEAKA